MSTPRVSASSDPAVLTPSEVRLMMALHGRNTAAANILRSHEMLRRQLRQLMQALQGVEFTDEQVAACSEAWFTARAVAFDDTDGSVPLHRRGGSAE